MTDKACWESFKAEGATIVDKLRDLVREGNVRRVVIEHGGKTVAEFPLTVGVFGTVLAPVAAAIGALVAVLQDCTIHIERMDDGTTGSSRENRTPPAERPAV